MKSLFPLLLILLSGSAIAQSVTGTPNAAYQPPRATAVRFEEPIEVDGRLDEPMWQRSTPASDFWETFPADTSQAEPKTEIYFGYDDKNLYIGAICHSANDDYVVTSLRRDYRAGGNDNITFLFNPFRDKTNAIVFGMNTVGVNREALIFNGGEQGSDFLTAWDNKWRGESYIGEGYWSCELAIPYTSLRFPAGQDKWYFNSYRFDTQSNTRSTWHRIPQNQIIMSLAYMGSIDFLDGPPAAQGANIALIPYASGSVDEDFLAEGPEGATRWNGGLGGDAKIGIGTGLNLDLTVNPDFSQVEVDQQVINTTRFEIFFPERRQFFLENSDLFGDFGFPWANPFFSRRIGVTRDTSTGEGLSNPIYFGARLSGKVGNDWRIGLLNMQTASNPEQGLPSLNYTTAALQRQIGARSNVGAIFVNKQNFGEPSDNPGQRTAFNRVFGLDYNLASADNRWNGKTFLHRSVTDGEGGNGLSHGLEMTYRVRHWQANYYHASIAEDFNAEVGFVPRLGFSTMGSTVSYIHYPDNPNVVTVGPGIEARYFVVPGEGLTDREAFLFNEWAFGNTSELTTGLSYEYIQLLNDFDPSRTGATPLPGGRGYGFAGAYAEYRSDRRKKFSFQGEARGGQFYNGSIYGIGGNLVYRYQPYGSIDLAVSYQYIDLPRPFASTALFLIGPRIDFTFTKSLFLTAFFQYNDQIDNINVNTRLQWRFAPVSDFFLVYTDNYDSLDFGVKNRAIVAKVTYWLNI